MSLKFAVLNSSPPIISIKPELVVNRLDCNFYDPSFLSFDDAPGVKKFDVFTLGSKEISSFLSHLPGFNKDKYVIYKKSGVPYLLQFNVGDGFIDIDGCEFIDNDVHKILKSSQLRSGDVVITTTGALHGKSAVIPNDLIEANACPDVTKIVCSKDINPYYLSAYINSKYGYNEIRRQNSGAGRPRVIIEYLREVRIVKPDKKIQKYIGSKVRLAEKCRSEAKKSRDQIKDLLNTHTDIINLEKIYNENKKKTNHFINYSLVNDRLDSEFYSPANLEIIKVLKSKPWVKLNKLINSPIKGVPLEYDIDGNIPALTVTNIDPEKIYTNSNQKITESWSINNKKAIPDVGEIIFTVTGPPLGEAAVIHSFHGKVAINGDLVKLTTKNNFQYPNYISSILNTIIGSSQVTKYCKGVRQKHLYPSEIEEFILPDLNIDVVKQIDSLGKKADILENISGKLISEAKKDIEDLIEGKLDTEAILSGNLVPPTWEDIEAEISTTEV